MKNPIKERVEYLIKLCAETLATESSSEYENNVVDTQKLSKFRTATLSFLSQYYGESHPYYESFYEKNSNYAPTVRSSLGILEAVLDEVSEGWYKSMRGIVSAEVFSDFVEMANHLLDEGFKDAAAVMIGSTLEEHLRQLARDNGIDVEIQKPDKTTPKKADVLNAGVFQDSCRIFFMRRPSPFRPY